MYLKKIFFCHCLFFATFSAVNAQHSSKPFYKENVRQQEWVDSVFNSLTLDERIGQLFMVAAFSNRDSLHVMRTLDLVCNYNVGGLCFFQGGPIRQARLNNFYQKNSKVPLLISIDGEWGLAMRLDSTIRFPRQMTMGAMRNEMLIYDMAAEIARQCKRIGIHVNLAPVIDINNNPLNPVISIRSFGENKYNVTRKGLLYMKGMQDQGVMANAKHFPGHGDTEADSHKSLPVISRSKEEMDSLELFPFRKLIKDGLGSLMVAHLFIPAFDTTSNTASTLSYKVVNDLLKNEMKFKGLIFTDALNMKGVTAFYEPGKLDVKALVAGNDVLLYSEDVPTALREIKTAIDSNILNLEQIEEKVKKILAAKYWCGLAQYQPVDETNLYSELNTPKANYLNRKLFENAITVLRNKNKTLPLRNLASGKIASVIIGDSINVPFNNMLYNYAPIDFFQVNKNNPVDTIVAKLTGYERVIISIHNTNINPQKNYGITEEMVDIINKLKGTTTLIVDIFGNPYTLSKLRGVEDVDALIMSYEGTENSQNISAQVIFGGASATGVLPVSISEYFKMDDGIVLDDSIRLKYTFPEEIGIPSEDLVPIDSIVARGIRENAFPGCQVLVAKAGRVIYNKSFGHHMYDRITAVKNSDLYDIASITKIASTTLVLMDLFDDKKINLDKKVSKFLPELRNSNKKDILFREMLAHQAGLQPWIPFWKSTLQDDILTSSIYRSYPSDTFSFRVAENIFINKNYTDTIFEKIKESPLREEKKYIYSDLGFIMTKKIIEAEAEDSIQIMAKEKYYQSMGLSTMTFHPRKKFPVNRIVPTENDLNFRKQLLQGDVHDPAAAMMGGIAGHAGLFSNANDLAIIMQMLLQNGEYGGVRYLKKETVQEFTRQQYPETPNRRGLGFDKPETDLSKNGPTCKSASMESYGHSGFTGTCVWADPKHDLIYVFLSNRVHPDAENDKLVKMNIRTDIQQVIYNAIKKSGKKLPEQAKD